MDQLLVRGRTVKHGGGKVGEIRPDTRHTVFAPVDHQQVELLVPVQINHLQARFEHPRCSAWPGGRGSSQMI